MTVGGRRCYVETINGEAVECCGPDGEQFGVDGPPLPASRLPNREAHLVERVIVEASRRAGITTPHAWQDESEVLRLMGGEKPGDRYGEHVCDVLAEMGLRSDGRADERHDNNQDNDHIALP